MLLDRVVLCDQTSQRLQKYGIDHGVSSGQCAYPSDLDSDRDNLLITKEVFAFRRLENRAIC